MHYYHVHVRDALHARSLYDIIVVHLSVILVISVRTPEWIQLVFGLEATPHYSFTERGRIFPKIRILVFFV